jgi:hypothetical protein
MKIRRYFVAGVWRALLRGLRLRRSPHAPRGGVRVREAGRAHRGLGGGAPRADRDAAGHVEGEEAVIDEQLRRAERAAREAGDERSEARLIVERLRAGSLSRQRAEIAARVGHTGARAALGFRGAFQPPTPTEKEVGNWVRGLARIDREAGLRAALAASRCVLREIPRERSREVLRSIDDRLWIDYSFAFPIVGAVSLWVEHRTEENHRLLDRGHVGEILYFWRMLSITAREWETASGSRELPTGARTAGLALRFLEFVPRASAPSWQTIIVGAISRDVSEWALSG